MTIDGIRGLRQSIGKELGPGDWHHVEQSAIDTFAQLSGDDQWIHVDAQRSAQGPYGATVAHGLLTLASLPKLIGSLRQIDGVRMGLNYGYDRVRFPAPLPVGSRIRGWVKIVDVTPTDDGGTTVRSHISVEIENGPKPCLVADHLMRVYFD